MKKISLISAALLLIANTIFASDAGAIWLLIPPSATFNGLGEIGVCLPSEDIYSGFYNPANGVDGYDGIGFNYSQNNIQWLPNLADDLYYKNNVLGISLLPSHSPLQIVLSKSQHKLDFGEMITTDEYGNPDGYCQTEMNSDNLSLASKYSNKRYFPLDIYAGVTRKKVIQDFGSFLLEDDDEIYTIKSDNILYDIGFLVSSPISVKNDICKNINLKITPAFGYSLLNFGSDITFSHGISDDPSPRHTQIGFSVTAKLEHKSGRELIAYRGGRAAGDLLVEDSKYQTGLGDINIIDHVLLSKNKSKVELKRGHELEFLDFLALRYGKNIYEDGGFDTQLWGFGLKSDGLLKFLSHCTENNISDILPTFIAIEYNYSQWNEDTDGHSRDDIEFWDLTLRIKNLDRLLKKDN